MGVIEKSRQSGFNWDGEGEHSGLIKSLEGDWLRMQRVLELKEEHPGEEGKKYLINSGLVSAEEYGKYKGKSIRRMDYEETAGAASIMHQVVGAEVL
jgi:hypothetical protein